MPCLAIGVPNQAVHLATYYWQTSYAFTFFAWRHFHAAPAVSITQKDYLPVIVCQAFVLISYGGTASLHPLALWVSVRMGGRADLMCVALRAFDGAAVTS